MPNYLMGHAAETAEIVKALGLDPDKVASLNLDFRPEQVARARVEMMLTTDDARRLTRVLKQYLIAVGVETVADGPGIPQDASPGRDVPTTGPDAIASP